MKKLDDSAQLLLIAGFAIGVGIVVITVMLNNVIYASNMASESSIDTSRYDIANAIQTTTEAYQDAYIYSRQNGNNSTLYEEYINSYTRKVSQNYATGGFTFHLQNHNYSEPYYTHNGLAGGKGNWTLVNNVNTTESFFITPKTSTMGNESNPLVFEAVNQSGSSLWSIKMYNSSGNVNITVTVGSLAPNYSNNTGSNPELNITGNKINNETFIFNYSASTEGQDYSINIYNASNTIGMCTISGNLTSGRSFTLMRHNVANPTLKMSSSRMSVNRTVPVLLPGGIP
ncbi:hypothetical protein [Methanolobus halotolerans]|uniref:Uncharacterized protein n=1 Tax=Methanolobus halotolerans TaxID=2052935 RepID=A0A4E0Q7R6_9EURY|nr:hypothetical protein [Methanolobus halotolerans]TGC07297.1 hypothetical protein CUN85_11630 [Methanolobus halotolerans]